MSKEEIREYYESCLLSLLTAMDVAGRKIAGPAGEVYLREVGYALSEVGFKKLPRVKTVEEACEVLQSLWKKLRVVGEIKVKSIRRLDGKVEVILGFHGSNCSKTVEERNLERGASPLCRLSMYFMERNFSRLLGTRSVTVSFEGYENGVCYEKIVIRR